MIDRGNGEVATLVAGLVPAVSALFDATGVPGALDGVDEVVAGVLVGLEADIVEDVELGFRTEVRRVCDTGRGDVRLSLRGDVTWIATVRLIGEGIADREVHDQRLG